MQASANKPETKFVHFGATQVQGSANKSWCKIHVRHLPAQVQGRARKSNQGGREVQGSATKGCREGVGNATKGSRVPAAQHRNARKCYKGFVLTKMQRSATKSNGNLALYMDRPRRCLKLALRHPLVALVSSPTRIQPSTLLLDFNRQPFHGSVVRGRRSDFSVFLHSRVFPRCSQRRSQRCPSQRSHH